MRLYSANAPITGSSCELGSTPRGFPSVASEPVGRYSGNVYAPQEGMHARKLACPCGHVFPAKVQQTKRKRPIESRQSDYVHKAAKRACETGEETVNRQAPSRFSASQICVYTQVAIYNAEGSALQCFHLLSNRMEGEGKAQGTKGPPCWTPQLLKSLSSYIYE